MKAILDRTFKTKPSEETEIDEKAALRWVKRHNGKINHLCVIDQQDKTGEATTIVNLYLEPTFLGDCLHLLGTTGELADFINYHLIGVPVQMEFIGHNRFLREAEFYRHLDRYSPITNGMMRPPMRVMFDCNEQRVVGTVVSREVGKVMIDDGHRELLQVYAPHCSNCWEILGYGYTKEVR